MLTKLGSPPLFKNQKAMKAQFEVLVVKSKASEVLLQPRLSLNLYSFL